MSHDELIEGIAREQRYRGVLVASAAIGVVASAAVGIGYALVSDQGAGDPRSMLGVFALPFAASITVGAGVYNLLVRRAAKH